MPHRPTLRPLHKRIFNLFYLAMALVYLAMGLFFVFFPQAKILLSDPINLYFGSALLVYGCFRAWRAIIRFFD